ncbi:MAG: pyruvate kinase [Proteobacteria bacterium]|nr:MAG: pyruvate kinase [Pseudomonadota bacterium]
MRPTRNAKIVATLGPASDNLNTIRGLVNAGADVFRLNFSHGEPDEHRTRVERIRAIEHELDHPLGILLDLQGPKLRIGEFAEDSVRLESGKRFRLDLDETPGDASRVNLPHPEILNVLEPGARLLLNDGRIHLEVIACDDSHAECSVVTGGELSDRKGVNVPGATLPISAMTDKDRADLAFGLELGVDWVALSFVQRPEDVVELRERVGDRAAIMTKLEKPAAIVHLDEIVSLSDAVMVARGDLGVEMRPEEVPSVQKRIVRCCRRAGKPVVVATQMLESMITSPTPTRAETTDVATAIYDGVDAVMLSGETAIGDYPVEAVAIMHRIICETERDPHYRETIDALPPQLDPVSGDAICAAMSRVVEIMPIKVAITYTDSGSTALRAARERPRIPILCLTPYQATARRMQLVWGVHAEIAVAADDVDTVVATACSIAAREGYADPGEHVIITAGMPFRVPGNTNLLRIARLREEHL